MDTQGLVLKAKVHAANVFDRDGIKPLMELVGDRFPRLSHLWLDVGYNGKGTYWAEKVLGLTVEVVRPPSRWGYGCTKTKSHRRGRAFYGPAEEMGSRANVLVDRAEPQAGLRDYESLTATSEAFVYVAMSRPMVKRLARS